MCASTTVTEQREVSLFKPLQKKRTQQEKVIKGASVKAQTIQAWISYRSHCDFD